MNSTSEILRELKKRKYKVSTDTRQNLSGAGYFALKGDTFDGNDFVNDAIKKGASFAVSDNPKNAGKKIFIVKNTLETLQEVAREYRKSFNIPILVIGGSNGKTTSKDLASNVLGTKYKIHSTVGSLNNHFGVPLAILGMDKKTQIGVFEIGANHLGEHLRLLNIVRPTHVVVTNNGMDHLEGFGSPAGVRKANKEIYDWAKQNKAKVFVNKNHKDLLKDSAGNKIIEYPDNKLKSGKSSPIEIIFDNKTFKTNLTGDYNIKNIELALAVGKYFKIKKTDALDAISKYVPVAKRSETRSKNGIDFVVDCYNANPTSMRLSLQSFLKHSKKPRGVILGDMLEMGKYSETEHKKIADFVGKQKLDCAVFIGKNFKKVLKKSNFKYKWFADSTSAKDWFSKQKFAGYTFLLKGSRGVAVEKILEL